MRGLFWITAVSLVLIGCKKKSSEREIGAPKIEKVVKGDTKLDPLVSHDIFKRPEVTGTVFVRMIYLVFDKNSPRFGRKLRGKGLTGDAGRRSIPQTRQLVRLILKKHAEGEEFTKLMNDYSDDPHTGVTGYLFEVMRDGPPSPMKKLALRLKMNEVGIVLTKDAYRIVKRVPPPQKVKDIDSKDVMSRKPETAKVKYKVIHVGWRLLGKIYAGALSPNAKRRTQEQASQLAVKIKNELLAGADFDKLYKAHTEFLPKGVTTHKHYFGPVGKAIDEGHNHEKSGHKHQKSDDKGLTAAEKILKMQDDTLRASQLGKIHKLAVRLKKGESGIVTSKFGYHIVKRYE